MFTVLGRFAVDVLGFGLRMVWFLKMPTLVQYQYGEKNHFGYENIQNGYKVQHRRASKLVKNAGWLASERFSVL
jgi:hypothetical protein